MSVEARLNELGYELPEAPAAVGAYLPALRTGNTIVTSGQLPMQDGGLMCVGKYIRSQYPPPALVGPTRVQ